jgi:hypothetical protein
LQPSRPMLRKSCINHSKLAEFQTESRRGHQTAGRRYSSLRARWCPNLGCPSQGNHCSTASGLASLRDSTNAQMDAYVKKRRRPMWTTSSLPCRPNSHSVVLERWRSRCVSSVSQISGPQLPSPFGSISSNFCSPSKACQSHRRPTRNG